MVQVKPLVWTTEPPPVHEEGGYWAEGVGGWYHWQEQPEPYVGILWRADNPFTFIEPMTFEQAQQWAQADHETRVLALLVEDRP